MSLSGFIRLKVFISKTKYVQRITFVDHCEIFSVLIFIIFTVYWFSQYLCVFMRNDILRHTILKLVFDLFAKKTEKPIQNAEIKEQSTTFFILFFFNASFRLLRSSSSNTDSSTRLGGAAGSSSALAGRSNNQWRRAALEPHARVYENGQKEAKTS